jgi:hypothetical protein
MNFDIAPAWTKLQAVIQRPDRAVTQFVDGAGRHDVLRPYRKVE